jgi:hypothetical protein
MIENLFDTQCTLARFDSFENDHHIMFVIIQLCKSTGHLEDESWG